MITECITKYEPLSMAISAIYQYLNEGYGNDSKPIHKDDVVCKPIHKDHRCIIIWLHYFSCLIDKLDLA